MNYQEKLKIKIHENLRTEVKLKSYNQINFRFLYILPNYVYNKLIKSTLQQKGQIIKHASMEVQLVTYVNDKYSVKMELAHLFWQLRWLILWVDLAMMPSCLVKHQSRCSYKGIL